MFPNDSRDAGELIRHSDLAMYQSKATASNSYSFYILGMNEDATKRRKILNDLQVAAKKNQFEFYYQPQIRLSDNRCIGSEALIRWNHPKLGLILPIEFIPLAE